MKLETISVKHQHKNTVVLMLMIILCFSLLLSLNIGPMSVPFSVFWQSDKHSQFLFDMWLHIRLPRVLFAIIVGAALAVSGSIMQGLFKNPLADPGLLGISSGSALSVAIMVILPISLPSVLVFWASASAAFIGSLLITLLIFFVSQYKRAQLSQLLLLGIAINALCMAIVGVLSYISNDQQLRELSLWGMGSLSNIKWPILMISAVFILLIIWGVVLLANRLNILQLGDEDAHYMGINVKQTQTILLVSSALLVAIAVSLAGLIGFVGLVVPHILRFWVGSDHRWLLPCSALGGAILLLLSDTLARTVASPAIIPIGLLTCLIGAPWFLVMVLTKKHNNG